MKNKVCIVMIIIVILILAQFSISIGTVKADTITGSEEGVSWSFDTETGTLTFSGNGVITAKWSENINRSEVKEIIINEGITELKDDNGGAFEEGGVFE